MNGSHFLYFPSCVLVCSVLLSGECWKTLVDRRLSCVNSVQSGHKNVASGTRGHMISVTLVEGVE